MFKILEIGDNQRRFPKKTFKNHDISLKWYPNIFSGIHGNGTFNIY